MQISVPLINGMLADEYGVNRRTIENVINKKSWR